MVKLERFGKVAGTAPIVSRSMTIAFAEALRSSAGPVPVNPWRVLWVVRQHGKGCACPYVLADAAGRAVGYLHLHLNPHSPN